MYSMVSNDSGHNSVNAQDVGDIEERHTVNALHTRHTARVGLSDDEQDTDRESFGSIFSDKMIEMRSYEPAEAYGGGAAPTRTSTGSTYARYSDIESSQDSPPMKEDPGHVGQSSEDDDDAELELELELDEFSPQNEKVKSLLRAAWPVITSFFLSIIGNFILMIFAGHAHEKDGLPVATVFAGVSLSNLFCNVTFRSLIIGMTGT